MEEPRKFAAEQLEQRAKELLREQREIRRTIWRTLMRDRAIDIEVSGCVNGASALGYEIEVEVPSPNDPLTRAINNARNIIMNFQPSFKLLLEQPETVEEVVEATPALQIEAPRDMPKISDIILERLRIAGDKGVKAAEIRAFITQTYHVDIHEKTAGMSLYRLQKDGLVTRNGHIWFLAPPTAEKENPGGGTPGPNHSVNSKGGV